MERFVNECCSSAADRHSKAIERLGLDLPLEMVIKPMSAVTREHASKLYIELVQKMAETLVSKDEEKAASDRTKTDILHQIAKRDPREQFKAAVKETILEMNPKKNSLKASSRSTVQPSTLGQHQRHG